MAPVRETAAQAVGAAVQPVPVTHAEALLAVLHQLIQQQQWDVRHGGLLGLKYLLAARTSDSQTLLPQALPAAVLGLQVCTVACMQYAACFLLYVVQAVLALCHARSVCLLWLMLVPCLVFCLVFFLSIFLFSLRGKGTRYTSTMAAKCEVQSEPKRPWHGVSSTQARATGQLSSNQTGA